ncbi:hypothetical protein [Mucilaginibacter lacusdianchii]|uniref:hypothetical protein n=1 Tax=Mucilaginibacter lacusdianchii TaxID=2684211 RepID=UPI00131B8499|nr:hypothetical protein [Mucilaginibacter sp. JXJ CY 39]
MDIDKIIAQNAYKQPDWDHQLDEYLQMQFDSGSINKEKKEHIFFQSNELLMDIAANFFSYGNFKDKWDTSKCQSNFAGQVLLLKSEKMDLTFYWGTNEENFYLETYIYHAQNIRFMTDEFWSMILELKKYGKYEFSPMGRVKATEKPYFENKTSTVFQILRTFMLYQVEKMNQSNFGQSEFMELGQFTIKWPFHTDWDTLLEQACKSFKLLYMLNYKLWKISDLANKIKK